MSGTTRSSDWRFRSTTQSTSPSRATHGSAIASQTAPSSSSASPSSAIWRPRARRLEAVVLEVAARHRAPDRRRRADADGAGGVVDRVRVLRPARVALEPAERAQRLEVGLLEPAQQVVDRVQHGRRVRLHRHAGPPRAARRTRAPSSGSPSRRSRPGGRRPSPRSCSHARGWRGGRSRWRARAPAAVRPRVSRGQASRAVATALLVVRAPVNTSDLPIPDREHDVDRHPVPRPRSCGRSMRQAPCATTRSPKASTWSVSICDRLPRAEPLVDAFAKGVLSLQRALFPASARRSAPSRRPRAYSSSMPSMSPAFQRSPTCLTISVGAHGE